MLGATGVPHWKRNELELMTAMLGLVGADGTAATEEKCSSEGCFINYNKALSHYQVEW